VVRIRRRFTAPLRRDRRSHDRPQRLVRSTCLGVVVGQERSEEKGLLLGDVRGRSVTSSADGRRCRDDGVVCETGSDSGRVAQVPLCGSAAISSTDMPADSSSPATGGPDRGARREVDLHPGFREDNGADVAASIHRTRRSSQDRWGPDLIPPRCGGDGARCGRHLG
jgi:hypothetical protein